MIPVTRPVLPPLDEYTRLLEGIWDRAWLTNDGPLALRLEAELGEFLGARNVLFVANGTVALQIAIKAMALRGEVITTPFSYVATTASLVWEGCTPVFADVSPKFLTIDPAAVEAAITPRTTGILATHVYGIPCDVDALSAIARRHGLRVIYDAAHSFGATYRGLAQTAYGDVSTLSFHATKLFHTGEGGAIVTDDDALALRLRAIRSFGHDGPDNFSGLGINGKNSELHAAIGLTLLPRVPDLIDVRRRAASIYDQVVSAEELQRPELPAGTGWNWSYYPILLPAHMPVETVRDALKADGVNTRRYFNPPLNHLPYVTRVPMPVAEDAARRVLCLPLYSTLSTTEATFVAERLAAALAIGRRTTETTGEMGAWR